MSSPAVDQRHEPRSASPEKLVSASASSTIVRLRRDFGRAAATRWRVAPTPAPGRSHGASPLVGEQRRESLGPEKGATITAVMRGVGGDRLGRARQRRESRADAQRRARRETPRARDMGWAERPAPRRANTYRARRQPRQRAAPDRPAHSQSRSARSLPARSERPMSARTNRPNSARREAGDGRV